MENSELKTLQTKLQALIDENAKLVEKLAEAEAKVKELEAALEGFRICPSCGEEYTITYTLSEREKDLITANAVLQKKLKVSLKWLKKIYKNIDGKNDYMSSETMAEYALSEVESIAKTEGEK